MLKTTPWTQVETFWVRGFLARVGPDLLARGDRRVLAARVQPATAFAPGMISTSRPVVWHWELFDAFGTCIGSGSEANPEAGKVKADEAAVRAGYELG